MRKNVLSLMIITALCLPVARGDQPTADNALDVQEMMMKMAGAAGAGEKKPDSPFPDFAKVTEDMVADKGMFTLWSYKPGAKDKDSEKLLCQIPQSMLGQRFMISTSVSGGGFFTGFPLNERVVKWEMHDRQLVLVEPETRLSSTSPKRSPTWCGGPIPTASWWRCRS
jgi:hypothetical protein